MEFMVDFSSGFMTTKFTFGFAEWNVSPQMAGLWNFAMYAVSVLLVDHAHRPREIPQIALPNHAELTVSRHPPRVFGVYRLIPEMSTLHAYF